MNQSKANISAEVVASASLQNQKPGVWIGHVFMETGKIDATLEFLKLIGMRSLGRFGEMAILELRGGTHLVLKSVQESVTAEASFDLMVEDLEAQRQELIEHNYQPSEIQKGRIHSAFEVTEPGGNKIRFNNSHVVGIV
ncbi:MAG: VOC family protein [Cyanobacteria bacterium P01_F01_bin.143]